MKNNLTNQAAGCSKLRRFLKCAYANEFGLQLDIEKDYEGDDNKVDISAVEVNLNLSQFQ